MSIKVIVNGVEQSLPPIVTHEGWGMTGVRLFTSEGSQQIGSTYHGHRMKARIGVLIFQMPTSTLDDMYALREELQEIFNPLNNVEVKFDLGYGVRRIAVHYLNDMTMPWLGELYAAQRVAVSLFCPDPLFYDPEARYVNFELGGAGGTPVPTPVPTPSGQSKLDAVNIATTFGNYHSFPTLIRITGPITDPVITNLTLDRKLDFTGITIGAGHYYDINLLYGLKSVIDDLDANKIADLTDDSNLDSWMIAAHPVAVDGKNSIQVTGTAGSSATKIQIAWSDKYLGV